MIFVPYRTEVAITRWPVANTAIISTCVLCFLLLAADLLPHPLLSAMVLNGWNPIGILGHQLLHAGFGHLFFNMLFLWVFGNAVCETMGSWRYLATFFLAGTIAGIIHNIFDGLPAVGASGAINGIVGLYLILYPTNTVDCFYWFLFKAGSVEVTGYWLVILWFLGDAWGAFSGDPGVAYWAHLGGLGAGIGLGVLYETRGWAKLAEYDNPSLIDLLFRRRTQREPVRQYKTREELIREHQARESPPAEQFTAECPHCQQPFRLKAEMAGRTIQYPTCGGEIDVQASSK